MKDGKKNSFKVNRVKLTLDNSKTKNVMMNLNLRGEKKTNEFNT